MTRKDAILACLGEGSLTITQLQDWVAGKIHASVPPPTSALRRSIAELRMAGQPIKTRRVAGEYVYSLLTTTPATPSPATV